jgi:hypothetical protein
VTTEVGGRDPGPADPVRARRARIAGWVKIGSRVGYTLFLLALVLFAIGLIGRFSDGIALAIGACMVVGSVVLLPAIIFGYAVRAAEREDREQGV